MYLPVACERRSPLCPCSCILSPQPAMSGSSLGSNTLSVPYVAQATLGYDRRPSPAYSLPGSMTRVSSASDSLLLSRSLASGQILLSGRPRARSRSSSPRRPVSNLRSCRSEPHLSFRNFNVTLEGPNGTPLTARPVHTTTPALFGEAFVAEPMSPSQLEALKYQQVKL